MDGNILLKERTQVTQTIKNKIKITYSRSARAYIRQLANYAVHYT